MLESIETCRTGEEPFPAEVTLHELIASRAATQPSATAVMGEHDPFWGKSALTYEELDRAANHVACRLRRAGIRPGDVVAIMVRRSFAMMTGILGILKAGAAYLPISPDDPADRIAYIVKDAGAARLLVQPATAGKAPVGMPTLDLEDGALYEGLSDDAAPAGKPGDLAYVIYTSGSTGRPKGVMIEHRSVVNRLDWMQKAYPIGPGDVLLQKTTYTFDVSVWELFWWAIAGASLALLAPGGERMPPAMLEAIRKHRVSVVHFVPSMLSVFLEHLDGRPGVVTQSLSSLRRVFTSGEALSPAHVRKFNAIVGAPTGCRLTNLYGPTEATVDVTAYDCPAEGEIERVPIGKPIQNTRAYIVRDGRPVGDGEAGELCLAGIGLARGYLNRPELTCERFVELPAIPGERIYRTGDVARRLPDGNIEYLGREDHQVKIRGIRIELGEIENVLRAFPGVGDCVAVAKKYSETIVVIVAYVASRDDLDLAALKRHAQARLPEYMLPGHYERIAAVPLTASGKADRSALPEPRLGKGGRP